MRKIWPFTYYFLHFAAMSSLLPFLVLFYQQLGFGGAQIGLLAGIPPLVTLAASPFWTGLADSRHWHRLVMGLGIVVTVLVVLLLPAFRGFAVVFALILLLNIFLSPISALADSATLHMLGEERAMYGRIRLGGTLGWGLFAPVAGVLAQTYGLKAALWSFSAIMLVNFFVSRRFVHGSHRPESTAPVGIRMLVRKRRWINFLFLAFLSGIGTFSVASYLFPYMAELGAEESLMGLASAIATLTEIPIFFFGNRLVRRLGSYRLLTLALTLSGLRSLVFGMLETPFAVLILQGLGGMIFPAIWLAGVSYADENAPPGLKSSAQGLFGAMMFGVGSAVAGFAAGLLLESIGGRGMFLLIGMLMLAGLGLSEAIRRLIPEGPEPAAAGTFSSDK